MKIDFVTQFKNVTFQKQKKDNFSSQKQKDSKDKLLYYTLGGLALAVAGAVLYNKKAEKKSSQKSYTYCSHLPYNRIFSIPEFTGTE